MSIAKKQIDKNIRVRIAPSPTGWFHIGTARAALFNYLFAKKNKGKFILRIEDTDLERSKPEYEKDIIEGLNWLGIEWDEGVESRIENQESTGKYGPYRQSERTDTYKNYLQQLLDKNLVYFCPCSEKTLEQEKNEQIKNKQSLKHICPFRNGGTDKGIIRFRTPDTGQTKFTDLIRRELIFENNLIGDFSLAKALNIPLYNFAVVIDDATMQISHVIRGEDHISNTPKQILLQQALGLPTPQYAHLPLILGPDKSKLSKRHGATSLKDYRDQGYLSEALINFMVLLGWNPGTEQEIFSLKDLEKEFSLERVGKAGAIFNVERLDWINGFYIRQMNIEKLTEKCLPYLENLYGQTIYDLYDKKSLEKIIALEQERIKKLSEIGEKTNYFFTDKLEYDPTLLKWKNMTDEELKESLQILCDVIEKIKEKNFTTEKLKEIIMPEAEKTGDRGRLLWPLRVALTGLRASPDPFSIIAVLNRNKTLQRLKEAITKISK